MIEQKLFDSCAAIAGALHTETIDACLKDLEGWAGPDIEAFRQALAFVKHSRLPLPKRNDQKPLPLDGLEEA